MSIRGLNLGSWLLMEGYILGGRNISESAFKNEFKKANNAKELEKFQEFFRSSYITENDFKLISSWGCNTLRIPFHYSIVESSAYKYSTSDIDYLKSAVHWAYKYNLKVILDLHAAVGSQSGDWHADSSGKYEFFSKAQNRDRMVKLWEYLSWVFKDSPAICGYDLLNEPASGKSVIKPLRDFYKKAISAIRKNDQKHLIFIQGVNWAQDIDFLADFSGENIQASIHFYQPIDFTFNLIRNLKYPGKAPKVFWNKSKIRRHLKKYSLFSKKYSMDIYVGEFGINSRSGFFGEYQWLRDVIDIFEEFNFGWTYWTYKSVKREVFPDGITQYCFNPLWVRREGPVYGWENLYSLWESHKKDIISSWKTDYFCLDKKLLEELKYFFRLK